MTRQNMLFNTRIITDLLLFILYVFLFCDKCKCERQCLNTLEVNEYIPRKVKGT